MKDTVNFIKLFSGEYQKEVSLKTNLGLFLLVITFFLTIGLSILFFILPLVIFKREDLIKNKINKLCILLYFSGIGLGFILIEIALIQKFILFLGHPVYSLSVTLFSLLIFSGIGSYTTKFIDIEKTKKHILISFISLLSLILLYFLFLTRIFDYFIGYHLGWRIFISIVIIIPAGLVLGRFFPLGMKIIDKEYHVMIPWAWGLNGTTSVVGSVLALLLAINVGFDLTMIAGGISYIFVGGLLLKDLSNP